MKINLWEAIKTFSKEITIQNKLEGSIVDGYYEPKYTVFKIKGVIAHRNTDIWSPQIPGIQDLGEIRLYTNQDLAIGAIIDEKLKVIFKQDYHDLFGVYIYRLEESKAKTA